MCVKDWGPVFFGQPPYCFPLLLYFFSILTEFCPTASKGAGIFLPVVAKKKPPK